MLLFFTALIVYVTTPASSQNYPVFGTKRYHRSASNAQMPVPASLVANPSYNYNTAPKYYYEQRAPYAVPAYHENYAEENPYYYYPRQEYYGMPIYHGEYNPKPYYYAHPPSYSYYDDREVAANPLDDLHEEILQEDERERQHELYPPAAQEGWYEGNPQQDELTNNFLRNLIAYNREIDAQQQEEQEEQQQQQRIDTSNSQRSHQDYQNDRPIPIYEDEYVDYPVSDYEYVPEQNDAASLTKFIEPQPQKEKYNEIEDEDERQLKFLAHNQRSSPSQTVHSKTHHPPHWVQTPASNHQVHQHEDHKSNIADEDTAGPEEYDDAWINWDRKRSADSGMKMFPEPTESIRAFSNRKPTLFVEKTSSTMKPNHLKETRTGTLSTITTTTSAAAIPTSTAKPAAFSGQKEIVLPRPANSVPRTPFAKAQYDLGVEPVKTMENKHPPQLGNVYDTIKQLIAMQQKYQKNSSKLQKRFVSNEENLVRELDNLKRRSV